MTKTWRFPAGTAVAVTLCGAGSLWGPSWLAAIAGIALVCVLPGLALLAALRPENALTGAERAMATLGLSLVVVIAGSLVLAAFRVPLDRGSWLAAAATATVLFALIAWARGGRSDVSPVSRSSVRPWLVPSGLAVVLMIGAIVLSVGSDRAQLERNQPAVALSAIRSTADPEQVTISIITGTAGFAGRLELTPLSGAGSVQTVDVDPEKTWRTTITVSENTSLQIDLASASGDEHRTVNVRPIATKGG